MKVQRFIATTAGLALVASAPLLASAASATNNGDNHGKDKGNGSHKSQRVTVKVAVTQTQATAIIAARKAYFTSIASANAALQSVLIQVQTDISNATAPQRLALVIAKDAYQFTVDAGLDATAARAALDQAQAAYSAAVSAAKSAAQAKVDSSKSAFKTAVENAKNTYKAAVTAAFPAGTAIPNDLLNISSKSFEMLHGKQNWNSLVKIPGSRS
ncbi:MAG: hypothetical protein Q8L05_04205 [Actinomycetota bacterium]|nr:hypothetical protein [Actinomycetota bacterium]MDP2288107.1 hypothetical protein [Actinomycetota bacterium]